MAWLPNKAVLFLNASWTFAGWGSASAARIGSAIRQRARKEATIGFRTLGIDPCTQAHMFTAVLSLSPLIPDIKT
jgi:hypothetical protein